MFPGKKTVAAVTLWLLLTSAGMAHASSALLPSSTLMILWMVSATFYLQQQFYSLVLVAILATLAVGWPFGVVLFIPMGLDVLYQTWQQDRHSLQPISGMSQLIRFIVVATILVQATVMLIDYHFYGRWISPIWNIVQYNASGGGDSLYGVEPLSYYMKNILLNFNYIGVVAVMVLPFWWLSAKFQPNTAGTKLQQVQQQQLQWRMILVGLLLPLYLWLGLVLPRPHKEERFLYPCYPLFCFGAALTVDVILDGLVIRFFRLAQAPTFAKWAVQSAVWFPSTLLSALRILALSRYYQAPMILYATLNSHIISSSSPLTTSSGTNTTVCTCGEWYRFPSSFFLPENVTLGLLPSSFQGQLPQSFTVHGSHRESPLVFNDRNLEQIESYINSAVCQYMVVLQGEDCGDISQTKLANVKTASWRKVTEWPLLSSQRTRSTVHRAFYFPVWHQRAIQSGHVYYDSYVLYKRQKQGKNKQSEKV
jgi:alpha-1,2-mannosyltransferase